MKKGFLIALAVSIICMQTVSVSTVSAEDEIQQTQADSNASEIASKESENDTLTQQITELNTEIESAKLEIAQLQQQIDESDSTISGLNTDIEANKEKLKERIRAIYMAGNASNLEIIFGAKDFDDFIDKLEYVSIITEHDSGLINSLTDDVNVNKKAKKVLEQSKKDLETKSKELEKQKSEFQSLLTANKDGLNVLYNENQAIYDLLSEDDPEYANIQEQIQSYYDKQNNGQSSEKATEKATQSNTNNNSSSSNTQVVTPTPTPTPTQPAQTDTSSDSNVGGSSTTTSGYTWPVPGFYNLTSLWDEDRGESNHGALDIASGGIDGANVVAAHSGTVLYAENNCVHNWGKDSSCGCGGGYGNYVWIDHGDGYATVYAHMSSITVSAGDTVVAGQLLGFVGSTGYSTGAHLHFETRYLGVKYNPLEEYPNIAVTY
ncbi:MAG: peptidoglycan DD-metalloendopeptidase family protein [Acutalibacteraceae bacterium]|nr:peptidoglycan DD-metalloendopeptidase family protein [Acutalibacteraceae bacterium]